MVSEKMLDDPVETRSGKYLNVLADSPAEAWAAMYLNSLVDDPEELVKETFPANSKEVRDKHDGVNNG